MDEEKFNRTQATHTPAPWGWYDAWEDSEGIHSPHLGRVERGDRQTIVEARGADLVVSEPDARLIAAAPDLLAALEEIAAEPQATTRIASMARNAIAKARGS
jgi:hypothetical protein